jgi:hypothetical protein
VHWGAYSSGGLERTPDKREVDGSSPFRPTIFLGELAQLGEHLPCKQEVSGSIPLFSTIIIGGVAQLARAYGSYP